VAELDLTDAITAGLLILDILLFIFSLVLVIGSVILRTLSRDDLVGDFADQDEPQNHDALKSK
jgi:hypothetical protein